MKKLILVGQLAVVTLMAGCLKKQESDPLANRTGNEELTSFAAGPNQYLGVTCGFQYSSQLGGPVSQPTRQNISLYNPDPNNPNATWDEWVAQLAQAGVDFVCPNLTGSQPNTNGSPVKIAPMIASINARGLTNQLK